MNMLIAELSPNEWMVVVGGSSAAFGSLFTVICNKGMEAALRWRADKRIDVVRESTYIEAGYKLAIQKQDDRITQLEKGQKELTDKYEDELDLINKEHTDCEKKYAILQERMSVLEREVAVSRAKEA